MKRAITERDVETLAANGKLTVTRDMVLTPAARELISRKGLEVTYSAEAPKAPPAVSGDQLNSVIQQVIAEEIAKLREAPSQASPAPLLGHGSPLPPGEAGSRPGEELAAPAPLLPEAAARDTRVAGVDADSMARVLDGVRPGASDHGHWISPGTTDGGPGSGAGERAVVTVVGQNRPGIVARISAIVAECGGDLADISQVILDRYFSMIFIVNLSGLSEHNISFRVFKERLQDEAVRLGQVQVLVMHEGIFSAMHEV